MKSCERLMDPWLTDVAALAPAIAALSADRPLVEAAIAAAGLPLESVRWIEDLGDVPEGLGLVILDLRDARPLARAALAYVAASERSARVQTVVLAANPDEATHAAEPWARVVTSCTREHLAAAIAAACVEVQARFAMEHLTARATREQRRLEAMLAACDDLIGLVDANGTVLKSSVRRERMDGYDGAKLVGTSALAQVHPEDVGDAQARLARLVQRPGGRDEMRLRRRHSDGTYGIYDVKAINLLHDRHVAGVVIHFRDITETGAAQSALRVSEARLQLIAARLPIVLWIADPIAGRCEYVSPFFEPLWGVPRSDLLANPRVWTDGIHPDDRGSVPDPTAPLSRANSYQYRVVRPDGGIARIESHRTPVFDDHGELTRMVGVAIDVTERYNLEHQLLETRALAPLAHLAASVAHDFNNILGGMSMLVDLMLAEQVDKRATNDLQSMRELTSRGAALTRRLLDFVHRRPAVVEPQSLANLTQGMEGTLRLLLGPRISIDLVLDARSPLVMADRTQLEQLILNLAINARDAMPDGGTLRISVLAGVGCVHLLVADTGCGMDEETRRHMFEPFFTTKTHGTGLGLATVAAAVRAHGATVRVESQIGIGTVFEISFPLWIERRAMADQ